MECGTAREASRRTLSRGSNVECSPPTGVDGESFQAPGDVKTHCLGLQGTNLQAEHMSAQIAARL